MQYSCNNTVNSIIDKITNPTHLNLIFEEARSLWGSHALIARLLQIDSVRKYAQLHPGPIKSTDKGNVSKSARLGDSSHASSQSSVEHGTHLEEKPTVPALLFASVKVSGSSELNVVADEANKEDNTRSKNCL